MTETKSFGRLIFPTKEELKDYYLTGNDHGFSIETLNQLIQDEADRLDGYWICGEKDCEHLGNWKQYLPSLEYEIEGYPRAFYEFKTTWGPSSADPVEDLCRGYDIMANQTDSYITMKFKTGKTSYSINGVLLGSSVEDYAALEEKILSSPCSQKEHWHVIRRAVHNRGSKNELRTNLIANSRDNAFRISLDIKTYKKTENYFSQENQWIRGYDAFRGVLDEACFDNYFKDYSTKRPKGYSFDGANEYLNMETHNPKPLEEDHTGQIYNPITGEWKWL